jgi:hypothetical protein
MNSNESAIDAILKGVTYLIDKAIQKAPFDRVVSGIIVTKDGDTATLLVNGVTYTKVSSIIKLSNLKINDTVKVMIPQNRLNNMFILGKIQ